MSIRPEFLLRWTLVLIFGVLFIHLFYFANTIPDGAILSPPTK